MDIVTFAQCEFFMAVYLVALGLGTGDRKIMTCGLVGMAFTTIVLG